MYILNLLRKLKRSRYDPDTHLLRIEIDKKAVEENINQYKSNFPSHHFGAVLKSNAYGHGSKEIGKILDSNKKIEYLIVDSIVEAISLRDVGVDKKIIILGYIPKKIIRRLKEIKNIVLVVNSLEQIQFLKNSIDFKLKVHIKIDTGMNRQGIEASQIEEAIKSLSENKNIHIEGMLSHLADADSKDNQLTLKQIEKWRYALGVFKELIGNGIFHLSATSGTPFLHLTETNLIRIGIGLYGLNSCTDKKLNLTPIFSMFAKIVNLKKVSQGEMIGYNFTYKAENDMKIAVVPCGYFEGINRLLSNQGYFYYNQTPLKILGRISMNMTVVDISDIKEDISVEDEVEVFSAKKERYNSIENVAKICNTIPYEIVCKIPTSIKRIIKN